MVQELRAVTNFLPGARNPEEGEGEEEEEGGLAHYLKTLLKNAQKMHR